MFKNTYFEEHLRTTASIDINILQNKIATLQAELAHANRTSATTANSTEQNKEEEAKKAESEKNKIVQQVKIRC